MNFTREPIIETVITPREGCKLVVRNSKGNGQEDYFVDAIEVVSFGHSFFFRSSERPKSFLVPVSDYEILELKETRMILKNVSTDRAIKIGGGREAAPARAPRDNGHSHNQETREDAQEAPSSSAPMERPLPPASDRMPQQDRKRDKRRRGRRGRDRHEHGQEPREFPRPQEAEGAPANSADEHLPAIREETLPEEVKAPPVYMSKLFPPPPTLIKETLSRYKTVEPSGGEEEFFPKKEEKSILEEDLFDHPESDEKSTERDDEDHF